MKGASKKCHCNRSKCLKLYCECFAANVLCSGCKCINCKNTGEHSDQRRMVIQRKLSRNKTAFDPKFRASALIPTPGQSEFAHVRGCKCKRSNCAKKYCECFQAGVTCSSWCKCVECVNDGSLLHLRNFGVYDWLMSTIREPTASVIGQESIMMILPVHQVPQEYSEPEIGSSLKRKRGSCSQPKPPDLAQCSPLISHNRVTGESEVLEVDKCPVTSSRGDLISQIIDPDSAAVKTRPAGPSSNEEYTELAQSVDWLPGGAELSLAILDERVPAAFPSSHGEQPVSANADFNSLGDLWVY